MAALETCTGAATRMLPRGRIVQGPFPVQNNLMIAWQGVPTSMHPPHPPAVHSGMHWPTGEADSSVVAYLSRAQTPGAWINRLRLS